MHYDKLILTYIKVYFLSCRERIILMIEEQTFDEGTNEESGLKSKIGKYLRWFFISVTMIAILYTIVMAVMKKFGGA